MEDKPSKEGQDISSQKIESKSGHFYRKGILLQKS